MRRLLTLLTLLACSAFVYAVDIYDCYNGSSEQGGHKLKTNGIQSQQFVQQSFPGSTITVFNHNTVALATIFQDPAGVQPLANPFTSSSFGVGFWCAADGHYDVQYSGTGITTPFTVSDIHLSFSGGGGGGGGTVKGTGTPGIIPLWTASDTLGDSSVADDFTTLLTTDTGGVSAIQYTATGNCPGTTGTGCADLAAGTTPSNPLTGYDRLYADSASGQLKCVTGSGGNCLAAAAGGTVTSVGLTVNSTSPSGIFTVTGSPVTTSGTLNVNLAGTSGGLGYFSSSTVLSSSSAGTTHGVWLAQGAGNAPTTTGAGTSGQCLISNGASSDPTYQACGAGSVTSVGFTVNGTSPSGIFTVTGSPVTTSGTLNINLAGTSGGLAYFSSATVLSSSTAQTTHGVWLAEGAGNAPVTTGAGTAGQVLTSNGASSDPTFQAAGGGTTTITTVLGAANCTNDEGGNSGYLPVAMSTGFMAGWNFVAGQASAIYCDFYIPHALAGTPNAKFVLDIRSSDGTAGHTANFQTCDTEFSSSSSWDVTLASCAANQAYTTTSTAWANVRLTFNAQATFAADGLVRVKIATSTTGTQPTGNMIVNAMVQVDQTL